MVGTFTFEGNKGRGLTMTGTDQLLKDIAQSKIRLVLSRINGQ
ncbi:hypothetical protein [Sporosarcina limicola]|uniref:Uncharacterized protein n=1 Tax=Sporosarcina limicola TaxID=34101 RepID=A0A927MSU4_9BACL|nr:hypothetical protein [Sporosarcina limicola]MBE1556721.1 hypothetical protein [Sporosarcina limicola]